MKGERIKQPIEKPFQPREHLQELDRVIREGNRLVSETGKRAVVCALAGAAAFSALDAGPAYGAVACSFDKKTGSIELVQRDEKGQTRTLSFEGSARLGAEKVPTTMIPSPLFQAIASADITLPYVNESIQDRGNFRMVIGTEVERVKKKLGFRFESLSDITMQEAIAIASTIIEDTYTYDHAMIPRNKGYSAKYERMIDGLPSDQRFLQAREGLIPGGVCRNYAIDFENVLECIMDISGASWRTRVHVDTVLSPQQRHAWNVVFEDTPSKVRMGVVDITFSDARLEDVTARFSSQADVAPRDAKDSQHQSLLEVFRSELQKSFSTQEGIDFLSSSLEIEEHKVNTLNFSTELLRLSLDRLLEMTSQKVSSKEKLAFLESQFTNVSRAAKQFKGSGFTQSDTLEHEEAAGNLLAVAGRHADFSVDEKLQIYKKSIQITKEGYLLTAKEYEGAGLKKQADEWYQTAVKNFRRPDTFKSAFFFYQGERNETMMKKVLDAFDYNLITDPYYEDPLNSHDGHQARAKIAESLGNTSRAMIEYGSAYRAAQDFPRLRVLVGIQYAKSFIALGRDEEGNSIISEIIKVVEDQRRQDASWSPNIPLDEGGKEIIATERALKEYVTKKARLIGEDKKSPARYEEKSITKKKL